MKQLFTVLVAILLVGCANQAPLSGDRPSNKSSANVMQNRKIVEEFARLFYSERNVKQAFERYVVRDYIQHNPGIADSRDAAVAVLAPMFSEAGREFRIHKILVDGDMAVIHVHAIPKSGAKGASVFDMYRLRDGKIVEHWDAIQPVPETSANRHPMF